MGTRTRAWTGHTIAHWPHLKHMALTWGLPSSPSMVTARMEQREAQVPHFRQESRSTTRS